MSLLITKGMGTAPIIYGPKIPEPKPSKAIDLKPEAKAAIDLKPKAVSAEETP